MSESKSTSGSVSFCGLLTIAFIILKLCGVIAWSWWWVLSPMWIPVAIGAIAFIVWAIVQVGKRKDKKERIKSGYNEIGWREGGRSKWQERLDQMKEAQKRRANT